MYQTVKLTFAQNIHKLKNAYNSSLNVDDVDTFHWKLLYFEVALIQNNYLVESSSVFFTDCFLQISEETNCGGV